jgi:hypothetical protein
MTQFDIFLDSGTAVLSACRRYRYQLERNMVSGPGEGRRLAWIMVNPSTADATQDDQTISKCIGFTRRLGFQRLVVGNKFAFRAKEVKDLRTARDPVGPDNDVWLRRIISESDAVLVAWGPLAKLPKQLHSRWRKVVELADREGKALMCLGDAADGHPRHPLMLAYETPLVPWTPPKTTRWTQ